MTDRPSLIGQPISAINLGLASFADPPRKHGAEVVHLDWRPPAGGDPITADLIAKLADDPADSVGSRIQTANTEAFERIIAGRPLLIDIQPAASVIPGFPERTLLHAGPPIDWDRMCGPMQGAVVGAIILEGWATDLASAEKLAADGGISFVPAHHFNAVGPMAGIISPSMPVWIARNETYGNFAYTNINEGLGRALRYGANGPDVIDRLRWMSDELGPALRAALGETGPIDLKAMTAQALQMGDECHNRNVASTSLFTRAIAPALARTSSAAVAGRCLDFLRENGHFFLNLSMVACKASLDAAANIPHSSVVVAMARNGVDVGIRVSGTGDRWFTAPAQIPDALYFPGYGPDDANPDIGDSAITETRGIGAFAMATAPAIVRFIGGSAADALRYTQEMGRITVGRDADFGLPVLDFIGTPTGIDIRRVVETGIAPVINTGVAHKRAGVGQVGAGIVRAPLECFVQALHGLAETIPTRV